MPFIKDQIIKHYSNSILDTNISPETLKANNENDKLEVEFDFSSVEDVDIKSLLKGSRNFNKDLLFGSLMDMLSDDKANKRRKPIISLMTCYHSSNTGKRFFALGELVDEYPID